MDKHLLTKLMSVSKLDLTAEMQSVVLADFERMLTWIDTLQAIDTTGVEPLTTLACHDPILRDDVPQPPLDPTKARNLSSSMGGVYFSVPNFRKIL